VRLRRARPSSGEPPERGLAEVPLDPLRGNGTGSGIGGRVVPGTHTPCGGHGLRLPALPPEGGAPSRPATRFAGASGSDLALASSRASPSGHPGFPPSALRVTILRPPPALRRVPAGAEPKLPRGLRPAPSLPKERRGRSKRRCRSLGLLSRPPWRSGDRSHARHPEGATRDPAHLRLRGPSFRCRTELSSRVADPPDLGAILADARRSCR
jgi:hypothetical protein